MSLEQQSLDLLEAFKARFGLDDSAPQKEDTKVLSSCQFVAHNSIDVFIDRAGTQAAASRILAQIKDKPLSAAAWSAHELHPSPAEFGEQGCVRFLFAMDLLNFSFWSARPDAERFAVEYRGKRWTGYWSLVAALRRALEEGVEITSPDFWQDENECTDELMAHVFRSATAEEMPLLKERLDVLWEAGNRLYQVCVGFSFGLWGYGGFVTGLTCMAAIRVRSDELDQEGGQVGCPARQPAVRELPAAARRDALGGREGAIHEARANFRGGSVGLLPGARAWRVP